MKKMFSVVFFITTIAVSGSKAESYDSALPEFSDVKVYADFRLRFESVEQDNALSDADALTLRSRIGLETGTINNFSATVELEDSRPASGLDDYSVGPTGFNPGEYSVIADPETTEFDQFFIQYKSSNLQSKFGRQVITLDNHRFLGHVGWRQDRQTFDAFQVNYSINDDLKMSYIYIDKRNRIFADEADLEAKDHLINASLVTSLGKLTSYAYLFELDNDTNNALDNYGLRFSGKQSLNDDMGLSYTIEFAQQTNDVNGLERDADYALLEAGLSAAGLTLKLGLETLGSDNGQYGFATPLATLHKFNGWADVFLSTPAQGLEDLFLTLQGKLFAGKWSLTYHDYSADEATALIDDFGDEWNLSYARSIDETYGFGLKFASYSSGDVGTNKVDTDKVWFWLSAKF